MDESNHLNEQLKKTFEVKEDFIIYNNTKATIGKVRNTSYYYYHPYNILELFRWLLWRMWKSLLSMLKEN